MSEPLALLMSDLVDSTGTTQRLGAEAAQRLWAEHDRLARALLARWGGIEVDKSDGFLMIFEDAASASRYALAYHQALTTLPEPVTARVGIHVAPVDVRPNLASEVELGAKAFEIDNWMAKALTSRLMSLARGGQILLSAVAAGTLGGSGLQVRSHGHFRVQGLDDPIQIFEVGDTGTAFRPPADAAKVWRVVERAGLWVPVREVRHSLPSEPDDFVGRAQDLLGLSDALAGGARLCTLLGIGGIGKTRLALRLGWQRLGDHAGGVWFCDLSSAQTRDGLLFEVAQGLQANLDQADPVQQIGQTIAARGPCLVILDNFDRLIPWAGETVARWMRSAPEVRFIVTSRQVLSVPGERAIPLSPLALPEAAALFERRAREAAPDRTGSDSSDEGVMELVRLLDGLPLAIELAAARVRVMSPRHMVQRMGQRFRLLSAPGRMLDRHTTMRAVLDWSWEGLDPAERRALAELTVFEGSLTLADAEAVLTTSDDIDAPWMPDLLQSLVEKSMLRVAGSDRFELLRNVQEYAAEHLATPGHLSGSGPDGLAAMHARHWHHFSDMPMAQVAVAGDAVIGNLVVACRRAAEAGDASRAAGALTRAWALLRRTGPYRLVLDLTVQVLALTDLPVGSRAGVERVAGQAHELLGQADEARKWLTSAVALAREGGDADSEGWALVALGEHLYKRGQADPARQALDRALQLGEARAELQCAALNALGTLEMRLGHVEAARERYVAGLALARAHDDRARIGGLLGNLAILAHDEGQEDMALSLYEEALAMTERGVDRRWEGNTRCNLGLLLQERGRGDEAESQFQQALTIARDIGHAMLEGTVECNLGILLDARGDLSKARLHHQQALAVARRVGERRAAGQFGGYLAEVMGRLGQADEALRLLDEAEAGLRQVKDEASLALLNCQRAVVEFLAGQEKAAQERLATLRTAGLTGGTTELQRSIERAEALMARG